MKTWQLHNGFWWRVKHWLKVASVEWSYITTVAREDLMSTLAICERVLADARATGRDQPLDVAQELDESDRSQLMPQQVLNKLVAPLTSYNNEYTFKLLLDRDGAAAFSIRQAKVLRENPVTGVDEDRREEALNKCIVIWKQSALKEAALWWLAHCYSPKHMPQGVEGPVQELAKFASAAPNRVPLETKAAIFAIGLAEWIGNQHADVSPAALPFVLTMEPTYEFNAWSFNAVKKNWLERMTTGFAWALIGDEAIHETLTLADGSSYHGEHQNGKPHGYGEQTWPDKKRYKGEFQHGRPHGIGTMAWPDGIQLDSRWRNGRSLGVGTMTLQDGTWHRGGFRFGRKQGKWTAASPDGSQIVSHWFLGKRLSTSRSNPEDGSAVDR